VSLITLNRSMSSTAIASGVPVRTALTTSTVASRSHVAALSRPVFESALESLSSWTCRRDRWSKVTTGSAASASHGLPATPYVTRTPVQISAPSLYSGSRLNTSVRYVAAGSVALTAVMTTVLFRASFTRTLTAITRVHAMPRRNVPPECHGITAYRL
jgi:hypothetical protein